MSHEYRCSFNPPISLEDTRNMVSNICTAFGLRILRDDGSEIGLSLNNSTVYDVEIITLYYEIYSIHMAFHQYNEHDRKNLLNFLESAALSYNSKMVYEEL